MGDEKELTDEIKSNARNDRARLESLCDGLLKLSNNAETMLGDEMAKVAVAEQLTRATDSLTRVNSQLVELAKIQLKRDLLSKASSKDASNSERESLYDEIQKEDGSFNN